MRLVSSCHHGVLLFFRGGLLPIRFNAAFSDCRLGDRDCAYLVIGQFPLTCVSAVRPCVGADDPAGGADHAPKTDKPRSRNGALWDLAPSFAWCAGGEAGVHIGRPERLCKGRRVPEAFGHSSPLCDSISGSLAMFAAIRLASSYVSTCACRASFSSFRKYV
jgi:hypothetical protein